MTKLRRDSIYNAFNAASLSLKVKYDSKIILDRKSLYGERTETRTRTRTCTHKHTHGRTRLHSETRAHTHMLA